MPTWSWRTEQTPDEQQRRNALRRQFEREYRAKGCTERKAHALADRKLRKHMTP